MAAAATELVQKIKEMDPKIFNIDFGDLENMQPIGGGNFGQVYRGVYYGTDVAIKQLLDIGDKDMHKYIEREMQTLRDMRHPNVVQFMGLCKHTSGIYIVTEFVAGGDLRHILKDEKKVMPWFLRVSIATDVAQAMTFLHSKGFIHRDLKSNNLLVNSTDTHDGWRVKVCDFGFARNVNRGELMTLCGTDEWMAPEVMCGDKYDEKADVFSYAMILYELITRKKPPQRLPAKGFAFDVDEFKRVVPTDCPQELVELTIACAEWEPLNRPAFKTVLERLKALQKKMPAEAPPEKKKHRESRESKEGGGEKKHRSKKSGDKKTKHRTKEGDKKEGEKTRHKKESSDKKKEKEKE
eukprot:CAMPEP_0177654604 /NCGR_PEP_ID=MMETSP0447-20121125/14432_1 /TAXON_ID=0 /ORGANISM="Stygamoeba regulata, Strain BSH-02190019" /LENGTH=351 /DNA_ID=CAMNT_0019158287 /DNA_START=217 /DNA_END=1272 /DNA_ORIENTATION=+